MANLPISGLTASASNLASTDLAPVVQTVGVGPVKMTGLQLAGGLLGSTTFNGSTVTTSSPVLNLSQTWNDGAGGTVTFTGLKFNATDTASASGSLLLDLQVGGVSRTNVTKFGAQTWNIYNAGSGLPAGRIEYVTPGGVAGMRFWSDLGSSNRFDLLYRANLSIFAFGWNVNSNVGQLGITNAGNVIIGGPYQLSWNNGELAAGLSADLFLTRANTATLQLGAADAAAPVAQTFKVQGVVAGTTNTAGANFTIQGSQGTGTGAGGSIIFQVAPAGSAGSSQNGYSTALTIDSGRTFYFAGTEDTFRIGSNINPPAGSGGIGIWTVGSGKTWLKGYAELYLGAAGLVGENSAGAFGFTGSAKGTLDVLLARDAANTLALRNGTNAQTFYIYNTYTDASNYERGGFAWNSNQLVVSAANVAGTGVARDLLLSAANVYLRTSGNNRWQADTNGHFLAVADNTYDIGASGASRPRNIYVAGQSTLTGLVQTSNQFRSTGNTTGMFVGYKDATPTYAFAVGMNRPGDAIGNDFVISSYASSTWTASLIIPAATPSMLAFSGTTSSFPALKRISSGNCLQVIAADNTASAGFIVGNQALATSATDGFLYVPTCAGTPTGTPTTQTGTAPIVVDTTNNKLYFYSGGQWRDAGP